MLEVAKNNRVAISLQYLKENVKDEVDFSTADKRQRFLQIHAIILGLCDQVCPNNQKSKFAISLQYLMKKVSDEINFLHADKHESFLQIDTMIFRGMVKHSQSLQNSKFVISLQYLKNMRLIFCMQINIKVSYKLISTLRVSKFPTR